MLLRLPLALLIPFCYTQLVGQVNFIPPSKDLVENTYYEGVIEFINTSSNFRVKSFKATSQHSKDSSSNFNLSFYVPIQFENAEIEVFVRDNIDKYYYMKPVQKRWEVGLNSFSWSKDYLASKLSIESWHLNSYISTSLDRRDFLIPSTFSNLDLVDSYKWVVTANQDFILEYTVYNENREVILPTKNLKDQKNVDVHFDWVFQDIPSGFYLLKLKYTLISDNGLVSKDNNNFWFYHWQ